MSAPIIILTSLIAGAALARLLPTLAGVSLMVVAAPAAGMLAGPAASAGLAAGAAAIWALALARSRRAPASQGSAVERAQRAAEEDLEALAGTPGAAYHEDLAIAALLSAIESRDPDEQLAGFREAGQLARQGLRAAAAAPRA